MTSKPRPILLKGAGSHRVFQFLLDQAPCYRGSLKGQAGGGVPGAELVRIQRCMLAHSAGRGKSFNLSPFIFCKMGAPVSVITYYEKF